MKLFAVGLLAAGIVSGVVIYGMAQPNDRPAGPPREAGGRGQRDPAGESGNREQGNREQGNREQGNREPGNREPGDPGRREFHVLPPEAKDGLKLSDEQLKQIVELDKDVQAKLAKILTPAQLERWNKPQPLPGREPGPREGGPRDQQGPPPRGERRDGPGPEARDQRPAGPPPRGEDGPPPRGERRDEAGPPPRGEDGPQPPRRDRSPADRRGPPNEGDRPAPRGEGRPEPRGIPTAADAQPQLPPPPHGPQEIDRALDELKLDGATRDKAHQLIKAHHEKVRAYMEAERAELVKQMKQVVGDAPGAEFEKSLPLPPPPPPER